VEFIIIEDMFQLDVCDSGTHRVWSFLLWGMVKCEVENESKVRMDSLHSIIQVSWQRERPAGEVMGNPGCSATCIQKFRDDEYNLGIGTWIDFRTRIRFIIVVDIRVGWNLASPRNRGRMSEPEDA
jgi:hypothetical protein